MKILVTGGAGYIGSHTALELLAAGYDVVVVDNGSNGSRDAVRRVEKLAGKKMGFYEADLHDMAAIEKVLMSEKVDGVIHFAGFKAVGESVAEPLRYYDNNVGAFVSFLQTLIKHDVQHFVFSSSAAVYGQPSVPQVLEETPCEPESPYGWSKRMDEIILRDTCAAQKDLRGVALRYFNVVGAHESGELGESSKGKPQNLLPIIVQATAGITPPFTVFGNDYATPDGTCQRDYIHVVDLAKAHVAALDKILASRESSYDVYNIGTGLPTSVMELITAFEQVNNVKAPYKIGARRPGDPAAYYASAEKANRELGWHAEKTIEDAVADAWRWQQNQT